MSETGEKGEKGEKPQNIPPYQKHIRRVCGQTSERESTIREIRTNPLVPRNSNDHIDDRVDEVRCKIRRFRLRPLRFAGRLRSCRFNQFNRLSVHERKRLRNSSIILDFCGSIRRHRACLVVLFSQAVKVESQRVTSSARPVSRPRLQPIYLY